MKKTNIYMIIGTIVLLLIVNSAVNRKFNFDDYIKSKAVPYTFKERLEVLKYEKKLDCECYEPCNNAVMDGHLYGNPQNALDQCNAALYNLENLSSPSGIDNMTMSNFDFAKGVFISKTKSYIKEAKKTIKNRENPPGIIVNLAPLFEPKNCDAYGTLDAINNNYDLRKVMYDVNSKSYYYVQCENLSIDDLESLLIKYDSMDKK